MNHSDKDINLEAEINQMDNGQKFYVMMNLKLFHACEFCSPKGGVMYSDFKIECRSKIPHKNRRKCSPLFQQQRDLSFWPTGNGIQIFAKKFDVVKQFFNWTSVHLSMSQQKIGFYIGEFSVVFVRNF